MVLSAGEEKFWRWRWYIVRKRTITKTSRVGRRGRMHFRFRPMVFFSAEIMPGVYHNRPATVKCASNQWICKELRSCEYSWIMTFSLCFRGVILQPESAQIRQGHCWLTVVHHRWLPLKRVYISLQTFPKHPSKDSTKKRTVTDCLEEQERKMASRLTIDKIIMTTSQIPNTPESVPLHHSRRKCSIDRSGAPSSASKNANKNFFNLV